MLAGTSMNQVCEWPIDMENRPGTGWKDRRNAVSDRTVIDGASGLAVDWTGWNYEYALACGFGSRAVIRSGSRRSTNRVLTSATLR